MAIYMYTTLNVLLREIMSHRLYIFKTSAAKCSDRNKKRPDIHPVVIIFGGDGEIRTLVPVAQQTHFECAPL